LRKTFHLIDDYHTASVAPSSPLFRNYSATHQLQDLQNFVAPRSVLPWSAQQTDFWSCSIKRADTKP